MGFVTVISRLVGGQARPPPHLRGALSRRPPSPLRRGRLGVIGGLAFSWPALRLAPPANPTPTYRQPQGLSYGSVTRGPLTRSAPNGSTVTYFPFGLLHNDKLFGMPPAGPRPYGKTVAVINTSLRTWLTVCVCRERKGEYSIVARLATSQALRVGAPAPRWTSQCIQFSRVGVTPTTHITHRLLSTLFFLVSLILSMTHRHSYAPHPSGRQENCFPPTLARTFGFFLARNYRVYTHS